MTAPDQLDRHDAYAALRRGDAVAVIERDVVRVAGPQAETFLQGQLSQDIAGLAAGAAAWSFLLEPTGKVLALLHVVREGDEAFLLVCDAGCGPDVATRLNRFKLRTKAAIEPLTGWLAWARPTSPVTTDTVTTDGGFSYVLGDVTYGLQQGPLAAGVDVVDRDVAEAWRIEAGVPRVGADLVVGETIPAEAGQWLIDAAVSFTKGCYTGQELVARIDSRGGNVPRHLRGVRIDAAAGASPPAGAEVVVGDKVVGALTSVAWSPGFGQPVALAMVARSVEPPAEAQVRDGDRSWPAAVESLPLDPPAG